MKSTTTDRPAGGPAPAPGRSGNQLLWIAAGVFVVLLAAWTVLFIIAHRHPVAPVPLTAGGGAR
ncbi:MAG: hypothetical protein PHE83_10445 [Opitutaceae bacterium]|nr:hypothetical protein [Opitutaceae bacterium]